MLVPSSVVVVFRNVSLRVNRRSLIILINKVIEVVTSKDRVKVAKVISGVHRVSLAVVRITVVIPGFLF